MRWLNAVWGVCALVWVSAFPAAAQPPQSDEQILIQLERDWEAAVRRNDTAFVDGILAEEYIATYDDGTRADRATELGLVAAFNQRIDSSRLDEFTIQMHGETALVWFTLHLRGPVQGRPTDVVLRYLDVWVKRDGRWLCVASQSTRVSALSGPVPE